MIKAEILVPLLNANEPEARVAGIHAEDGKLIEKGSLVFTIETTKTATDIICLETGFLHLLVKEGDLLAVGDRLAVITDSANKTGEILERSTSPLSISDIPQLEMLRITKPARVLADALGMDLTILPTDRLITEDVVRQLSDTTGKPTIELPTSNKPYILVFGGGGHAKTVIEMVQQLGGHTIAGIVDDDIHLIGKQVLGLAILGTRSMLSVLRARGVELAANCVGGILDINVRVRVFDLLENAGFNFPALVHPRATLEKSAQLGEGIQVFANAYIGSEAILHPKCMVNTNAVVSHDCVIGEYSHIAPGALLAGHVSVGGKSLVGMGVTTAIGVHIGSGVRIGNGAIVLADVPDRTIVQAGRYWVGKA